MNFNYMVTQNILLIKEIKHQAEQFIEMYDGMLRNIKKNITNSKIIWDQTMPLVVSKLVGAIRPYLFNPNVYIFIFSIQ